MLKDKYRFQMSYGEAQALHNEIQKTFVAYGSAKELEVQLPLATLMDFQKRLIGLLLFPQPKIKLYLKRTEALAFQILYMGNSIESTMETMQLAHSIDTTL
jgi:hypothetical protein